MRDRTCVVCGARFETDHSTKKYCSHGWPSEREDYEYEPES